MTAHIMANEREKCLSYGMNDYLSKPFKEIDLYNIVNQYIGTQHKSMNTDEELLVVNNIKSSNNYKIIKPEHLYSLSRGNNLFIKEVIQLFLEQNPKEISDLEQGVKMRDYAVVSSIAHKMKTSIGFIGIEQLFAPLNQLEKLAINQGNLNDIQNLFNEVKKMCQYAVIELNSFLKEIAK
jgi:HPt (histidine-containing phosphotransfer) domain-containing protein